MRTKGMVTRFVASAIGRAVLVVVTICATSALADGIERWGSDRYVQDGLIAHFDGLENTAYGAQHSDAATQWTSITGTASNIKFSFSGRNSSVGSWRPDGRYFDGNAKGETTANITLGDIWTVQATLTMDMGNQLTSKTTPKSQYPIVFASGSDNISAYLNNNGSQTTTLIFKDNYNGLTTVATRPSIEQFGGRYLTVACDRTDTNKTYFTQSTTTLGSGWTNGVSTSSVPELKYYIGGTEKDANHYMKGTMHSLRFYNRLLTDAEMAQNIAVDEVRFRGNGVIVCTLSDGLEGTEACGFYTVDGSHEFSAPAETDVDGTTWQCVGYELYKYNSTSDTWSPDGIDHQGELRYSYDSTTDGRVQLKWLWTKKYAGYAWTGSAGDGKFSTPANWVNIATGGVATEPPSPGLQLVFSAAAGGTITNDVENLGGEAIVFPEGAGAYTITGNGFTNVANVINESASVQTLSNEVFFATAYNVALEKVVNFAGGATATTAGTVTGSVGGTLTGDITFTGNWVMNASYTVPSGSRIAARKVTGSGAAFTINKGGYAHFASIQPGKNNTVWRINLNVNGTLEVDGNVDYWNSGDNGSVQAVSSSGGTGVIIAKGFYKHGGKQHLTNIKTIKIGAGSASSDPIFGSTYKDNMLHFFQNITIQAMADIEFQSEYSKSHSMENGGISLHEGKTMTINTEDDDGTPHTIIWGCSFCVKANDSNNNWAYSSSNVHLIKQGKGTLIMRNRCSLTGSSGYTKYYYGYTDVKGGTLRVEEKGQLSGSTLRVYGGARFELANSVALPNNATLTGGGNSIDIGDNASLKLTSSSGDNAAITMGTNSTLTGNVSLGTNTTMTVGANSQIIGSVTVGTNSTVTLGVDAQVANTLTINDGTTLALDVNAESGTPIGGGLKLASGQATIKLTGDFSFYANRFTIKKKLCKLDPETNVGNLTLDATGVTFPPKGTYSTRLRTVEENASVYLMFRASKNTLRIYLR